MGACGSRFHCSILSPAPTPFIESSQNNASGGAGSRTTSRDSALYQESCEIVTLVVLRSLVAKGLLRQSSGRTCAVV